MISRFATIAGLTGLLFSALLMSPLPAAAEEPFCFECHDDFPEDLESYAFPHEPAQSGDCTACHEDHGDDEELILVEEGSALCYQCHDDLTEGQSVHGPVSKGNCTSCHNPHGSSNEMLLVTSPDELCLKCHENGSEFIHEVVHEALDEGCYECHLPHSSTFPKLLASNLTLDRLAIFEEKQAELCFNCHDQEALTSAKTDQTEFRNGQKNLHALHLTGNAKPNKYGLTRKKDGQTCVGCHLPHTSIQEKLIRTEFSCRGTFCYTLRFTRNDSGGTCVVGCHKPLSYSRNGSDRSSTAGLTSAENPQHQFTR